MKKPEKLITDVYEDARNVHVTQVHRAVQWRLLLIVLSADRVNLSRKQGACQRRGRVCTPKELLQATK